MLEKDPNKRISISEIMLHPWISKYKDKKMRKEWGYSSSSNDSLILDDENDGDDVLETKTTPVHHEKPFKGSTMHTPLIMSD